MLVAGFSTRNSLGAAVQALRAQNLCPETYTPNQVEDAGPDAAASPLPTLMLAAFILGSVGFFALQLYATTIAYPLDIGGKPDNSWPAYIANAFEAGVLFAMLTGVFGYFVINGLPLYYHPVDRSAAIRKASRDGWFLSVESGDQEDLARLLAPFEPTTIEMLP